MKANGQVVDAQFQKVIPSIALCTSYDLLDKYSADVLISYETSVSMSIILKKW